MSNSIKLSTDEYNILNKITRLTKTDCWFWLEEENGNDVIYDLEEEKTVDWETGLQWLQDAVSGNEDDIKMTNEEWETYYNLLSKFNIDHA